MSTLGGVHFTLQRTGLPCPFTRSGVQSLNNVRLMSTLLRGSRQEMEAGHMDGENSVSEDDRDGNRREQETGANFFMSVVLTVNMVVGAGVVGLPFAFFHAGQSSKHLSHAYSPARSPGRPIGGTRPTTQYYVVIAMIQVVRYLRLRVKLCLTVSPNSIETPPSFRVSGAWLSVACMIVGTFLTIRCSYLQTSHTLELICA